MNKHYAGINMSTNNEPMTISEKIFSKA
ncbi:MAG: hypothetical protein PWQ63_1922, partial [Methanolobus sp.]|nr:hypothetical protein [Methanolobus sp.]